MPKDDAKRRKAGAKPVDDASEHGHAVSPARLDSDAIVMDESAMGALSALAGALGREPDAEEAVAWAAMSPANREVAVGRIRLLRRWFEDRGDLIAATAAEQAGLKIARFYDLAARWNAGDKRLFDVGRFAKSQSERKGRFDAELINELQAVLPKIVSENSHLPVIKQVELLVAAIDVNGRKLPATNTLREMVDRERRRRETRSQAGTEPAFDFIGSGLGRAGGGQHLIFAVIDRTSRLVLGAAIGRYGDSRAAYAAAAADARQWLSSAEVEGIGWTGRTERIDVVPGGDVEWWRALDRKSAPVDWALADGAKSPGRFFRAAVGPKLGRLKLYALASAIASGEQAEGADVVEEDIARLRVKVEVAAHNAAVKAEMDADGEARPAPTTLAAMDWIAGLVD